MGTRAATDGDGHGQPDADQGNANPVGIEDTRNQDPTVGLAVSNANRDDATDRNGARRHATSVDRARSVPTNLLVTSRLRGAHNAQSKPVSNGDLGRPCNLAALRDAQQRNQGRPAEMKIVTIAAPAAALVVGLVIGVAGHAKPPEPVVRTVSVPRTPQSCLIALNLADRLLDTARIGFVAVGDNNLPRMKAAAKAVNEAAPAYANAKTQCVQNNENMAR